MDWIDVGKHLSSSEAYGCPKHGFPKGRLMREGHTEGLNKGFGEAFRMMRSTWKDLGVGYVQSSRPSQVTDEASIPATGKHTFPVSARGGFLPNRSRCGMHSLLGTRGG